MHKILRVNMAELSVSMEPVKEEYGQLGGRALIARLLLDEVKPTCEPLGRHNKLIFAPGLLGGSRVPSSGRISIGAKSPLTGGVKESNGGGVVGLKLGRLGYKAVVFEDLPRDDRKYLLLIDGTGARLLPAGRYWGMGVYETARELRKEYGHLAAVACIGPAGERKFSAAGIANTDAEGVPSRYSGRGGLGAVLGAKGIKAVVINDAGAAPTEPARPDELRDTIREFARYLKESPVIKSYADYGTAALVQISNAVGGLPTCNFSTGKFLGADNISGETMHDRIMDRGGKTTHACMPGCLIQCSNVYVDEQGAEIVAPLEYETIALLGSNLGIDDLDAVARLNYLCNDYGLDTIETGAAIGVAMAGGLLEFGDAKGAINLVQEMGKGTLLGRVLGMGAAVAGKVLGVVNIPAVKGQAMPGYEPRAVKGTGVTYATSPMGADHTAGVTIRAQIDHHAREGQAALSRKMQYTVPIYDALGLCLFVGPVLNFHPDLLSRIVNAQLGTQYTAESIFDLARNTVAWELEFNRAAGFGQLDDRLPEYFTETPNPATGTTFDVGDAELDDVHGGVKQLA